VLILTYGLLAELLPLLMIAFAAFTPYLVPPTPEALALLGLTNFQRLDMGLVLRGLRNTLVLVVVVPVVVVGLAFCTSWLVVRSRRRLRYALEFGAFLPHTLPEVILAISALLVALFVVGRVVPLYGSVWLIAIVYVVGRLAFATRRFIASSRRPRSSRACRWFAPCGACWCHCCDRPCCRCGCGPRSWSIAS
jgi:iron(III) transport system permease protein